MKLRYSPTSPYVRKVMVVATELALAERIELVLTNTGDPASGLSRDNPLGKVPALITDDGHALYDSRVICEYLDHLAGGGLFPEPGERRWQALRLQALGDGMADAAILMLLEDRRPADKRWPDFVVHQEGKVVRGLAALEAAAEGFGDTVDIGTITAGCVLGYLDFRFPGLEWRADCPALATWYETFAERRSMIGTTPREAA